MIEKSLLSFALMGAGWVLWLLLALSVSCLAITLERALNIFLDRTPAEPFHRANAQFAKDGDQARFAESLGALRGVQARVVLAGLQAASLGVSSAEEAIQASLLRERLNLEKGLMVLGTVGANAPFIGLFGTVLGIIKAFHDLARNQAEAASAVMAGISEALVATATGLLVAIPAVVLYNLFQRYNKRLLSSADASAHILLAHLRGRESNGHGAAGNDSAPETQEP